MEEKAKPTPPRWAKIFNIIGKVFIALWVLAIIYIGYLVSPFVGAMYSITKIPSSYFEIKVDKENHRAIYKQVTTMPGDWVPLDKISKRLRGAIISSEDGKFYTHPGYDIEELQDAINDGVVKKKKKVRGASTITQQLIKNLYFQSDRSVWRKVKEMALTLWIEDHVEKDKILETYLNVIEYGENLYGIKDAAKFYFNKEPAKLTARESAFLAMLLPSPKRYAQSFRKKQLTSFANRIIQSVLFKMLQGGYIGIEEYYDNLDSRFTWEKHAQPEPNEPIVIDPNQLEPEASSDDLGNL
ncbi:monofunctional biosynthetic peptidoglycan transglycosylase [Bacteriovorax stolpii]|uniref:Monofunctional biosynthetic peptidoglycan transglycosylase n=1 Tax=Bacteriovorax stolpii TaxID=960 RepID=A0A2K9NXE4_BACTC|nr:monofunctional biosynthetic peptidoglycan transglycosylase [Bacteriovorax stolpii]TDP52144.1 monofunctional biosynthetic peptidoglycan transglycosylase [Bacteriovorax stolpii]